jgi:hypothetical protein
MSLVTTIDQVRGVIGSTVRKENTLEILKPYLDKAEGNLADLIGQGQLTALDGAVTGSASKLKSLAISAIVWNGYLDAWYQGVYQFTGSGVNRQTVEKTEGLFRYQEDNIQKDIVRKADEATEQLMLFLEANLESFPLYKDSAQFAQNFSALIPTPTALRRALPEVSKSYRMYQVMLGFMERVEHATVRSITGDDLYEDLKLKVSTGATLDANYKRLLVLAQDYIAPATLLEAMPWISVQFSPGGIRILKVFNNLQDENPLNDVQTATLMDLLRARIDTTKTALREYLNEVASLTVFPDYYHSTLYRAPGSKTWTSPDNGGKKHFRL